MKINKENKTLYIAALTKAEQMNIAVELVKSGIANDDLNKAMSGRVCDLEDTIKIIYQ